MVIYSLSESPYFPHKTIFLLIVVVGFFPISENKAAVVSQQTLSTSNKTYEATEHKSFSNNSIQGIKLGKTREVIIRQLDRTATIIGFRVEDSSKPVSYENAATVILADSPAVIRLFGHNFSPSTIIRFVTESKLKGTDCDDLPSTKSFALDKDITEHSATTTIHLPPLDKESTEYYICARENDFDMPWIHQGPEKWIIMKSYQKWLPLWAHILLLASLLILSGLFSGLNLGLMAMDRTELKIIEKTGTVNERRYAKKIKPLRNKGNYLLCSLLLGNVVVNSSLTILLDDLTSGLVAIIGSTLGIVIFGEIIPQAFCSRYGLAVGAHTVWVTKLTMLITFPLSYPVSFILDKILGEEIGNVYNRERLRELIRVTENYNDLKTDEMNVIEGVLKLSQCICKTAMTTLDDVFMLPLNGILDFDTINEIMSSGYSRIPVFDGERGNVVSLLYTKDLAFVDPDDKMPLRSICEFYQYPCNFVDENKTLDAMFKEFKDGSKGHMAFVRRTLISENSDPLYQVVGVITLEDVIEELIQGEIEDETDNQAAKNKTRRRSRSMNRMLGFSGAKVDGVIISPQLILAAFQFLSTSIPAFGKKLISPQILQRLLAQEVFFKFRLKSNASPIYERGTPADFFVLILEGRVRASMGKEDLIFEAGPFTYFGTQSLNPIIDIPGSSIGGRNAPLTLTFETMLQTAFIPDYTVQPISDVTYLKVSRSMYLAATQATTLERTLPPDNFVANQDVGDKFEEQIGRIIDADEKEEISRNQENLAVATQNIFANQNDTNVGKITINEVSKHIEEKIPNHDDFRQIVGNPKIDNALPYEVGNHKIIIPSVTLTSDETFQTVGDRDPPDKLEGTRKVHENGIKLTGEYMYGTNL